MSLLKELSKIATAWFDKYFAPKAAKSTLDNRAFLT